MVAPGSWVHYYYDSDPPGRHRHLVSPSVRHHERLSPGGERLVSIRGAEGALASIRATPYTRCMFRILAAIGLRLAYTGNYFRILRWPLPAAYISTYSRNCFCILASFRRIFACMCECYGLRCYCASCVHSRSCSCRCRIKLPCKQRDPIPSLASEGLASE